MSAAIVSSFHHDYRDLYKGLQSHRATTDFRQQVSVLERQLSNYAAASSLINIPLASIGTPLATAFNNSITINVSTTTVKSSKKQHAPLTSSNSVANCNAASTKSSSSREHRKLDRSVSEPADRSHINLRSGPPNSSRYKTELCRPFEENGTCKYGDKCQFAHGIGELRTLARHPKYKTELCRTFHTTGFCPYGPRCHFIHNSEDSKKCIISSLQNGNVPPASVCGSPPKLPSPPLSTKDLDISCFSIGSPCDLSPPGSTCSSGSPTSSIGGFFLDDNHLSYSVPQVPQTAPPIVTNGFFFGPDYSPSPTLAALSPSSLVSSPDYYPPQQGFETDENMIDMLVNEMDNMNCHDDEDVNTDVSSKTEQDLTVDINRNIIRLPIFSRLADGNSP